MAIPNNQIFVVTGDPRSGTSLMMQTLGLLGVSISGDKFPQPKKPQPGSKAETLNPKGYFEVPGTVMKGLKTIDTFGGTALKIIAPGLTRTDPNLVYKGVLCLRNPKHVAQSQTNLAARGLAIAGPRGWDSPTWNVSALRYMADMGEFLRWWKNQTPAFRAKFIVVDYDDMVNTPANTIARVAAHLDGLKVTPESVANVDPALRRSPKDFIAWDAADALNGAQCEKIYAALKSQLPADINAAITSQDVRIDILRRENTMVYDDRLCCNIRASFLRRLNANPTLLAKLSASHDARLKRGKTFLSATDFTGDAAQTYTIKLPADLGGDKVVKKINYNGKVLTREEAQNLHEQRTDVTVDKAKVPVPKPKPKA